MAWVKLSDDFLEHPKFEAAGDLATLLWVAGLAYCNRNRTDGKIPASRVAKLTGLPNPDELAERLVAVPAGFTSGLWERVDGGFVVHDYLEYQPSKAEIEKKSAERAEAGKKGAEARWGKPRAPRRRRGNGKSHSGSHS